MIAMRAARRGIPVLMVGAVLAASLLIRPGFINGVLAACTYGYLGAPTVTGISPTSGSTVGGTSVTISGCGFTGATGVKFGTTAASFVTNNDSTVTATSPAHAAGTVDVTVTTSAGTSATTPADQFTYMSTCTGITATPTPASTAKAGTIINVAASATGCANPLFEFWKRVPPNPWNIVQPFSARNNWNWDTRGPEPAGTYFWSVWVKDASSPNAYDAFVPGSSYSLTTAPCTAVSAIAAPASPQNQGTTVTITATGTCPTTALYQFWIIPPAGASWYMAQAYSTNNVFIFNTSAINGGYHWSVWVKDQSSPGVNASLGSTYDAFQPGQAYQIN